MTIDKNMSNEDYHAHPSISSTDVKMVAKTSLAHWKHKQFKESPALHMGSAVHALCLERHLNLVVKGPESRRGKAWTEAKAAADFAGQIILPEGEFEIANAIADSVLATDVGKRMAGESTINEMSVFVTDPDIGLPLKTRPDSYWPQNGGVIYDIKTCLDASPRGFASAVGKFGYAVQQAFYQHVLRLEGLQANNMVFVAVEKEPPYAVGVHVLSTDYIEWAEKQMLASLEKIKRAQDEDTFDTGWPSVNVIELPRYLEDTPEDED